MAWYIVVLNQGPNPWTPDRFYCLDAGRETVEALAAEINSHSGSEHRAIAFGPMAPAPVDVFEMSERHALEGRPSPRPSAATMKRIKAARARFKPPSDSFDSPGDLAE